MVAPSAVVALVGGLLLRGFLLGAPARHEAPAISLHDLRICILGRDIAASGRFGLTGRSLGFEGLLGPPHEQGPMSSRMALPDLSLNEVASPELPPRERVSMVGAYGLGRRVVVANRTLRTQAPSRRLLARGDLSREHARRLLELLSTETRERLEGIGLRAHDRLHEIAGEHRSVDASGEVDLAAAPSPVLQWIW